MTALENPPAPADAPALRARDVKAAAEACGFLLVGLARAEALPSAPLRDWLAAGHGADLHWMRKDIEKRLDPTAVLPGAQTVMAMGIPYHRPGEPRTPVARYARGRDYHYAHRDRLKKLRQRLLQLEPRLRTYACVDTGMAMEKPWAARAGLGWIGKNGCLIHPEMGSWFTLSVMFLNRAVDVYDEPIEDRCGSCDKCLRACPTDAFAAPQVVDCNRCIAYQSIENRNAVPVEVRPGFRSRAFGCDVCQDVCPYNRGAVAPAPEAVMAPRPIGLMSAQQLADLGPEQYAALAAGTPLMRIGYQGLRRNAAFTLGAGRVSTARPTLERLQEDADEQVAEAARWALGRLPFAGAEGGGESG